MRWVNLGETAVFCWRKLLEKDSTEHLQTLAETPSSVGNECVSIHYIIVYPLSFSDPFALHEKFWEQSFQDSYSSLFFVCGGVKLEWESLVGCITIPPLHWSQDCNWYSLSPTSTTLCYPFPSLLATISHGLDYSTWWNDPGYNPEESESLVTISMAAACVHLSIKLGNRITRDTPVDHMRTKHITPLFKVALSFIIDSWLLTKRLFLSFSDGLFTWGLW